MAVRFGAKHAAKLDALALKLASAREPGARTAAAAELEQLKLVTAAILEDWEPLLRSPSKFVKKSSDPYLKVFFEGEYARLTDICEQLLAPPKAHLPSALHLPGERKPRVLILTVSFGGGHNSAASSVQKYIGEDAVVQKYDWSTDPERQTKLFKMLETIGGPKDPAEMFNKVVAEWACSGWRTPTRIY